MSAWFPEALQLVQVVEKADVLRDRLETYGLGENLVLVLPHDVLVGVTEADGLPVVHADVPGPMLAHTMP